MQRYTYIDIFRGIAVVVMIETHVVNAFMLPELRETWWFSILNFINGIVAPAFLFIAGYTFALNAEKKWNDFLAGNSQLLKQVKRIFHIWLVGYALHIPFFSLQRVLNADAQSWLPFWKVDVLYCIAFSLLLMLFLIVVLRKQQYFYYVLGILSIAIIFLAPIIWENKISTFFLIPIGMYFDGIQGSQFPIFPWMGFVLLGGISQKIISLLLQKYSSKEIFYKSMWWGIGGISVLCLCMLLPFNIYPQEYFWRTNPLFFFIRCAIVWILLVGLIYKNFSDNSKNTVSLFGKESLVGYAGHLLVIYGLFFNDKSISSIIGKTRTVAEVFGMTVALLVVMFVIVYIWHTVKRKNMKYAYILQYSLLIIVISIFFLKN